MLDLSAFGKNDIRGIYGEDITEEIFYYTGRGFVKYLAKQTGKSNPEIWITVCRDARLHSPSLSKALVEGILSTGANVVDLGLAPTPIGYYSEVVGVPPQITRYMPVTGAMIITASHNPSQYNGMKMTYNKSSLNEEQIKEVKYNDKATEKEIEDAAKEETTETTLENEEIVSISSVSFNNSQDVSALKKELLIGIEMEEYVVQEIHIIVI